uniref:Saposin B-type domain-containing protein n=1 Tax=Trichobilharzia regenti TaxID=157069 RepID=A0AA85K5Y3_TRIRE|nr:unnamed protein product [Trichobilharzia regenti]
MLGLQFIVLFIVCTIGGLQLSYAVDVERISNPPSNDLICDVCEGIVNIGKLYLLSPTVSRILDNFVWKFCRLPGIVTKRCIPWAQDIFNRSFYNVLKTDSAVVCEYALLC